MEWMPDEDKRRASFSFGVAATVFLILGLGALLLWRYHTVTIPTRPIAAMLDWQQDGNAIDSIALEQMKQDSAYLADGIQIDRIGNQFFLRERDDTKAALKDSLIYHFTVGGNENIQVFFEDATRVQLAPKSSLTFCVYPPGTTQKENLLKCSGEMLIDVTANYNIPTVISTRRQTIAVLGTFFKVRDFDREDTSCVFCYHGKVAVSDSAAQPAILKDSQRVTVYGGRNLKVARNDFPIAKWSSKELVFDFSNDDLDDAMRKIARWYGMRTVIFQGEVNRKTPGMVFIGPISRYLPLQQLLSILERKDLHFSIQDNKILVKGTGGRLDHSQP